MGWTNEIRDLLLRSADSVEDAVDAMWTRTAERLGWYEPEVILAYRGYADAKQVHVEGRVLANAPCGGPQEDDAWWENLAETYRRFASRDVADAELELSYGGETKRVRTNDEGYYSATFDLCHPPTATPRWRQVAARLSSGTEDLHTSHRVLFPGSSSSCMVISDIDDTVLETGVSSLLTMARLTFLSNARTRSPLPGVSELYRALRHRPDTEATEANPVFYLSNSPWNLYDLLRDFLELNRIPEGPLFLQDFGIEEGKFIKPLESHKSDRIDSLIDGFPELPVILLGDSGEADPMTYLEAAKRHPGRVRAIYIRDVDPDTASDRDTGVAEVAEKAMELQIPTVLGRDSNAFAEHAAGEGWIPDTFVEVVRKGVARDQKRPRLSEESLSVAP